MTYTLRPLSCEPTTLKGLSEKLVVNHSENNYGGAVRLNAITARLAGLDFTTVFRALRYSAEEIARAKATAGA